MRKVAQYLPQSYFSHSINIVIILGALQPSLQIIMIHGS